MTNCITRNSIPFTPTQTEAIRAGMQPGLTMVVGPPGTGKTDVAVQIISNIYHNFPEQRTLIVTHSNQVTHVSMFTYVLSVSLWVHICLDIVQDSNLKACRPGNTVSILVEIVNHKISSLKFSEFIVSVMLVTTNYNDVCISYFKNWNKQLISFHIFWLLQHTLVFEIFTSWMSVK